MPHNNRQKKIFNLKKTNISEIINKKEEKLFLFRKKKSEEKTIQIKKLEIFNESIKKAIIKKSLYKKIYSRKN